MKKVALLVPDAGPLISLGVAGRLDVLLLLDLPIFLVDHVFWEVTRDESLPGAGAASAFVHAHRDVVVVVKTFVGEAARRARDEGDDTARRGLGEAAMAEFYSRIDEFVDPAEPILVLFEDSDVRRIAAIVRGNVHLLSTRALLRGMERRGLIPSAEEVWRAILAAGRAPSEVEIDRPAPDAFGGSDW